MKKVTTDLKSTLWYSFSTGAMFDLYSQLEVLKSETTNPSPEEYYDGVIRLIDEHYDDLPVWEIRQVLAEPKPSLSTYREAEVALKDALSRLHKSDPYTVVRSKSQMRAARKDLEAKGLVESFLEDAICYVKIPGFVSCHTADEVEEALRRHSAAEGYVIDLRGNTGGYLDQMAAVLSLLIDESYIGVMEGFLNKEHRMEQAGLTADKFYVNGMYSQVEMSRRPNLTGNKPMLVLIDNDTRSVAEMFAFLLRFEREDRLSGKRMKSRARLLGLPNTKTVGKSSLQQTLSIGRGAALRITSAYLMPAYVNITGEGIRPDLIMNTEGCEDNENSMEEASRSMPQSAMNFLRAQI